jgi:hypothetical protein
MMRLKTFFAGCGLAFAVALGGCANGSDGIGLGLTTASVEDPAPVAKTAAAKPAISPACVELAAKINAARAEGTPARVAKVAESRGGRTVNMKRASLAKMAELDALNQKFLTECSVVANSPAPRTTASARAAAAAQPILAPTRAQ